MKKIHLAVFLLIAVTWGIPGLAWALPPQLESKVQQTIQELKNQGASYEADACGGRIIVEAEIDMITPRGTESRPFPTEHREVWGCNGQPGGVERLANKFTAETSQEGDRTTQTLVNVLVEWNFDRKNSAELEGRVKNKDGDGLKNASVRLVNTRSGKTFETRSNHYGDYEIQVPSGEYTITAQKDSCSQTLRKPLCAFGPASGPASRQPRFQQDFKMDCGELALVITGHDRLKFHVAEEGLTFDASGTATVKGQSSFTIDTKTAKITGSGNILTISNGDFVDQSTVCDDGECHHFNLLTNGGLPDHEDAIELSGTQTSGTADLELTVNYRPVPLSAVVQLDGRGVFNANGPTDGGTWKFPLKIPCSEGASQTFDLSQNLEGYGVIERHLLFTLVKKEKAGPPPVLPPAKPQPQAPGNPAPVSPILSGSSGAGPNPGRPAIPQMDSLETLEPDDVQTARENEAAAQELAGLLQQSVQNGDLSGVLPSDLAGMIPAQDDAENS